jgi:hypothetical protein
MEICQRSFDGADKMLSMFKPCSQAHVGLTVYASDEFTISSNSADGPPAGKLIAFDSADIQGRPCRVALNCFTS